MSTLSPVIAALPADAPAYLKDFVASLQSYFKRVEAAGGFVTGTQAQNAVDAGLIVIEDPTYHQEGGAAALNPVVNGVIGITVVEELYASTTPGVFLSRLIATWSNMVTDLYEVELLTVNAETGAVTVLAHGQTQYNRYQFDGITPGDYQVRVRTAEIKVVRAAGEWSNVTAAVAGVLGPPDAPASVQLYIPNGQNRVYVVWSASRAVDVVGYRLRWGTGADTWESATPLAEVGRVTEYRWEVPAAFDGYVWVKAVDSAGVESTAATRSTAGMAVTPPAFDVGKLTAQVLDNTVLLSWQAATPGTFSVAHYEIRRSDPALSWEAVAADASTLVGTATGTFTPVYERTAGGRKYWVRAVDASGLASAVASTYATVAAADWFELYDDVASVFDGTLVNALAGNSGNLALPVDLTATYGEHFTGNSWSTPAEQVTAGYPLFIQPGISAGSYEEVRVYVPDSSPALTYKIIMDLTRNITGDATITPTILARALSTDGWTDLGNVYEVQPTFGYRQVKYRIDVAGTGGVCEVTQLRMRLQSKRITRTGSTDVGTSGTQVWLTSDGTGSGTAIFHSLSSIQLTPRSSTAASAVWDVGADPSPDNFHIYLFDAAGAPLAGTVDWTVTGV